MKALLRRSMILPLQALIASACVLTAHAQQWGQVVDLSGQWRFELGDDLRWAQPRFDDSKWDRISVPGRWEDQGYPGYDGFAWYRKHFSMPADAKDKVLYVRVGAIDDADEIYVNGHFVDFLGLLPPTFATAYSQERTYRLVTGYLNFGGDNVIAVRVYDDQMEGGITRGDVGVYEDRTAFHPDFSFEGTWKFTTGDDMRWADPSFDDSNWEDVVVPAHWETQGHRGYDGFGWYRFKFRAPANLQDERIILLAGKIDDFDETYLNGEKIGRTGYMPSHPLKDFRGSEVYRQVRAYTLPTGVLRFDQDNVLAIRVYDGYLHGGIYDGPLGLTTRPRYVRWRDTRRDDKDFMSRFWDFFAK